MREKNVPKLVVGIAGASASGKTLLLDSITSYLKDEDHVHLDLDGYHLHEREERKRLGKYPDEITENDFEKITRHIRSLRDGQTIDMPVYNHKIGSFSSSSEIAPRNIIFVEGLHSVLINEIANERLIDFSVFLYPDEDLRKGWKIKRDIMERGYSYSEVVEKISERAPFVKEHIHPQIPKSDMVICVNKSENDSLENQILISPHYNSKFFENKTIEEPLKELFESEEISLRGDRYFYIHSEKGNLLVEFIKGSLADVDLETSSPSITSTEHSPFSQIAKIILIFLIEEIKMKG